MKVKLSRIQKQRKAYASNRAFIQKKGKITEQDYKIIEFETGCRFLEEIYPLNTPYEKHFIVHSRNLDFWLWWRSEWKLWEVGLIEFIKDNKLPALDFRFWKQEMEQMALDPIIESSYHNNYLKSIKNGRTT